MGTFRRGSGVGFLMARYCRAGTVRPQAKRALRAAVAILVLLALASGMDAVPAVASATDYDGKWDIQDGCFAATGAGSVEPFALQRTITIANGVFSEAYSGSLNGGKVEVSFIGTIKDSAVTMFMDGKDANGVRWRETLDGHAASATEIDFDGTHFNWIKDKWALTHTCFGRLRVVEPASTPLSAPVPVAGASPAPAPVKATNPVAAVTPAPVSGTINSPGQAFGPAPSPGTVVPPVPPASPSVTQIATGSPAPASAGASTAVGAAAPAPASAPVVTALVDPAPAPDPIPSTSSATTFDGTYVGPIALSGMSSCDKTMTRNLSISVKDNHFDTTVFNVGLSIDLPASGDFNASGTRRTDHATAELTGKVQGQTMVLEMQNPYCKAHAILVAVNSTVSAPPAVNPDRTASLRHHRWPHTGSPARLSRDQGLEY
jgi:hypothetical protein